MSTLHRLPNYPSTHVRKTLSPSQLTTLTRKISSTLQQTLALPPSRRDPASTRSFIVSYSKDSAVQTLQGLIWGSPTFSNNENSIRRYVLLLASSTPSLSLSLQTLLDLAIIYAPTSKTHLRTLFTSALASNDSLPSIITTDLVPALTQLLSPAQGLYAARKAAHCLAAFLHAAPPNLARPLAHSVPLVRALATLYGPGLATIAQSYGGPPRLVPGAQAHAPDDWEHIWVSTKTTLIDAFHAILRTLLDDLSTSSGSGPAALAAASERAFGLVFTLIEDQSAQELPGTTPFLDRHLLIDYNATYPLARTLADALRHAEEKDAWIDILEAALQSSSTSSSSGESKDPGALTILLHSSGVPPTIDGRSQSSRTAPSASRNASTPTPPTTNPNPSTKGKARASTPPRGSSPDPDLDIKVTQVLDVLPDLSPSYIRALLGYPPLGRDPERVLGALLEGSAPVEGSVELLPTPESNPYSDPDPNFERGRDDVSEYVARRANVFDGAAMDLGRVHVGKKETGEGTLWERDKAEVEAMKADILRRAEAAWAEEEEDDEEFGDKGGNVRVIAFEEEEGDEGDAGVVGVRVAGDGEESGSDEDEGEDNEEEEKQTPETILELAYIHDSHVFERSSATRKSAARKDLERRTGWDQEQIEGWAVMLERDPKRKAKILEKHEFAGNRNQNRNSPLPSASTSASTSEGRGGARGQGQGQGRGRGGRGRGGGRGGGGGGGAGGAGRGDGGARGRAWKDRNKASRANHDRKRGHDKKMARRGGPSA